MHWNNKKNKENINIEPVVTSQALRPLAPVSPGGTHEFWRPKAISPDKWPWSTETKKTRQLFHK